jgi:hypothetical protein
MKCCDCGIDAPMLYSMACERASNPSKPNEKTMQSRGLCPTCANKEAKNQGLPPIKEG